MPSSITEDQIKQFSELFAGYDKAFGNFIIEKAEKGEKAKGKPWTTKGELPYSRWRAHLEGVGPGLGIIMLKANNTCSFGALDVDDREINHAALYSKIIYNKIPLVLCRSKSGGAHLYLFMKEECPAILVREKLDEWCQVLGLSDKTERFPKQVSRFSEEDVGNWINIPYQNAARTLRYCIIGEKNLTLEEFLVYAQSSQVTVAQLSTPYSYPLAESLPTSQYSGKPYFFEGPPCLLTIEKNGGFKEGARNNGFLNVCVYLRKRYGKADDEKDLSWQDHIFKYNEHMANLPDREIMEVANSVDKKTYSYTCKADPIASVCNRRVCLQQRYGVGETGSESVREAVLDVVRYDYGNDTPIWSFEINANRVMVDNDTFYNRDMVNKACMAQANILPLTLSPVRYLKMIQEAIEKAAKVSMPEAATPTGQLWDRIEVFLEQSIPALTMDEIASGKIYREEDLLYFRGADLFNYLRSRNIKYKEQFVWQLLRAHGATVVKKKVSGKLTSIWTMPSAKKETVPGAFEPLPASEDF